MPDGSGDSEGAKFALLDQDAIRQVEVADLIRHVNAAAYAHAAQLGTRMIYKPFRQASTRGVIDGAWSSTVNLIMQGCTGSPGLAEVEQDALRIEHNRAVWAQRWMLEALDAAGDDGFDGLNSYMEKRAQQRIHDLMSLQRVFRQTKAANADLESALKDAIVWSARVKLGCSAIIAVSPLAAGAGLFGAANAAADVVFEAGIVSFIYSVDKGAAKDVAQGVNPIPGEIKQTAKKGFKDAAKKAGSAVAAVAATSQNNNTVMMREAEKKIASLTRRLAGKISESKRGQIVRRIASTNQQLSQTARAATRAKLISVGAKSVSLVFAAKSVWDAIEEYQSDTADQ